MQICMVFIQAVLIEIYHSSPTPVSKQYLLHHPVKLLMLIQHYPMD
jgi:hypothetical protein